MGESKSKTGRAEEDKDESGRGRQEGERVGERGG